MKQDQLIWVNKQDEIIGYGNKQETHQLEKLHRAYSVFIYDTRTKKMLLQKRAVHKYHSSGLWSNACCSHPYKSESWAQAIKRGIQNELGISPVIGANEEIFSMHKKKVIPLHFLDKFYYYSNYGELSEHEIDYVFLFMPDELLISQIVPNLNEIEDLKWMNISEIDNSFQKAPYDFTSWFQQAYQIAKRSL